MTNKAVKKLLSDAAEVADRVNQYTDDETQKNAEREVCNGVGALVAEVLENTPDLHVPRVLNKAIEAILVLGFITAPDRKLAEEGLEEILERNLDTVNAWASIPESEYKKGFPLQ